MPATVPACHTGQRPDVRMTYLTRRAEKQVEKLLRQLPAPEQEKLINALVNPVRDDQCELVSNLAEYRLFHYPVHCTVPIRVCYRPYCGHDAVVVDVAKHGGFDRFADHHGGNIPAYLIPIEDSVMKRRPTQSIAHHKNAGAPQKPATAPNGAGVLAAAPDVADQFQRALAALLQGALANAIQDKLDRTETAFLSLVEPYEERATKLSQQQGALSAAQDELGRDLKAVSERVVGLEKGRDEFTRGLEVISRGFADLRAEARTHADSLAARLAEQQEHVVARIDQADAGLDAAMTALEAAAAALAGVQEELVRLKAAQEQRAWKGRLARFVDGAKRAWAYLVPGGRWPPSASPDQPRRKTPLIVRGRTSSAHHGGTQLCATNSFRSRAFGRTRTMREPTAPST